MKENIFILIIGLAVCVYLLVYYIKRAKKEKTFQDGDYVERLNLSRPMI